MNEKFIDILLEVIDSKIDEEFANKEVDEAGYRGSTRTERKVTEESVRKLRELWKEIIVK